MVAAALESCGVDTEPVLRSSEHATPVTTMFVGGDGTRSYGSPRASRGG